MPYAGIVLAGGAARRLSGVDKPGLVVGGCSLLARAVAAAGGAEPLVVVGPQRPGHDGVVWTREPVPGTGPVAALAAGLALVPATAEVVVLLAADLPGVRRSTVDRLRTARENRSADGALLVDEQGERQWLLGAWRVAALRAALPEPPENASLRRTLGGLSLVDVRAEPGESEDIDTPGDLERHR
ncbi:nucleotidyltransferase family protein [Amycolatopsis sp. PS_44_ISF1]|uniref:molybdenum cofactor guanylyltransferase n=1 Tax=Amycolatopsis sp. PS_44_ISF1 TaxID=2974917 RepID=UPI0028DE01EB|nr:nucleotidyltransferase family protein [Amycolatopsis sp. PS_44_ISF1]MDT8912660.1 nucleotidyltransferase family protein [Amycolatopsis sp. PS_44_ISF1]